MLLRLRPAWDYDLDLRPMNQNYIMKFAQNKPPMFVPNKGAYMSLELRRAASLFGVEGLSMPSGFPVDTTGAQLVLRALKDASDGGALAQATRAFMSAVWKEDRPVKTAADIKAVLVDSKIRLPAPASTDLDAFIARALEKDSFARLKEETRILVEDEGAFGVPWIIVTRASDGRTEKWFGSDRFEVRSGTPSHRAIPKRRLRMLTRFRAANCRVLGPAVQGRLWRLAHSPSVMNRV